MGGKGGGGGGGGGRKMAAAAAAAAAATATAALAPAAGGGSGGLRRSAALFPLRGGGCFLALLLAASLGLFQVSAVEIYTPQELSVENGTEAKLPCTFSSSEVISTAAVVTWSFQAEGSNVSPSFFFYSNGKEYTGKIPQFKDRTSWAGNLNKKDASISIANMQFHDNGTYICDVKNPPDIDGIRGEIKVRVVEKGIVVPEENAGNLPVFSTALVAGSIGGILGFILLIVLIVCVVYRKKNSEKHYSGCSTSESLVSPVKQAPRKSPSNSEGLVNSVPIRSHQGPVIYAQLDHSGGHYSDKIIKSESVVYADIRKN